MATNQTRKRRWIRILLVLLLAVIALFLFRNELLFAFQKNRLNQLGCSTENRNPLSQGIDHLQGCQKLWAHRVDSYERFSIVRDQFSGLETDVVFDAAIHNFRIYHPPADPGDLLLDTYLKEIGQTKRGLWIDVKGIDSTEYQQALMFFLRSDSLYSLRKNIMIESSLPAFINLLAENGFNTSFLAPPSYLEGAGTHPDSLISPRVKFVSQEDTWIPKLKEKFPGRKINTWAISFRNYFNLEHFRTLVADTSINIILINIKSRGYK